MNFFDMYAAGMQRLLTKLRLLFVSCCTAQVVEVLEKTLSLCGPQ